jgi:DMSO/TMAO reductase YedYZ molybdopterin-dependent catalytic subunit
MPAFDPATWKLSIGGLVQRPLTLSHAELLRLPSVEQTSNFHCVTGWEVPNVRWKGVRIGELLDRAGPLKGAAALHFVSSEVPYDDYLTLPQATRLKDVLLAWEMDGKPLLQEHGAPLRLVIPDMYGYKNVKWVSRIDLVGKPLDGFWEVRGYDRDAWVGRSNGDISENAPGKPGASI